MSSNFLQKCDEFLAHKCQGQMTKLLPIITDYAQAGDTTETAITNLKLAQACLTPCTSTSKLSLQLS